MAVEEMPSRSRAWAASVLTMSAGLGSGMAVWVLPLADLSFRGWRAIYLLSSLGIVVIVWAWRRLPETRRFAEHAEEQIVLSDTDRERRDASGRSQKGCSRSTRPYMWLRGATTSRARSVPNG